MTEQEQLDALTKNQKRYLSKHMCSRCERTADKPLCGFGTLELNDIHLGLICTEKTRIKRRISTLANYKPRGIL